MWILLDIQIEKDLFSSDLLTLASDLLTSAHIYHRCKYRLIVKNLTVMTNIYVTEFREFGENI